MTSRSHDEGAPLSGLRVVEFGHFIAVPAASQTLRDMGADVIKVEPASGDAARHAGWTTDDFGPMFASCNRGKLSVVLDLSSEQGRATAFKLAMTADVVLHNARPGMMQKAGLDAQALRAAKPSLIVGSVSGFSAASDFGGRPGFDIAAQAESGMLSINGNLGSEPTRVGFTVVDVMTSQKLTNAVLAALLRRGATGAGATIALALVDVAVESMAYTWTEYAMTGRMPLRRGNGQATVAPAADVVPTADGAVVIVAYHDEQFVRLAKTVGREELAHDPRFANNASRVANRDAMLQTFAEIFADQSTAAICERLTSAGLVAAAVRTFEQIRSTPNGVSPTLFLPMGECARGEYEIPALAIDLDNLPPLPTRLPAIGEHTDEILQELEQRSQNQSTTISDDR